MAISKTSNTYNRQMWEENKEFPILCQTCLGDNPYVRMTKEVSGKECKICNAPFTVFRWCPGRKMRFKKTEVCQTCSKMKNVCQTCLLDLEYGLPIQVRDLALKIKDDIPKSDVNKEYYLQNQSSKGEIDTPALSGRGGGGGKSAAASELLFKLARTAPYYRRNRPHICSFWVKGNCRRGEECPYRHEKPTDPDDPLAEQNIKDRYYGVNDPVAAKLMRRASVMPKLDPPEDKTITTLYIGNLSPDITENDLKNVFYQYGEIRNITMITRQQCSFVEYVKRADAELAVEKSFGTLILRGRRLVVKWGHTQANKGEGASGPSNVIGEEPPLKPSKNLPSALPPLPKEVPGDFFNLANAETIPIPPPPMPLLLPPFPGFFPPLPPFMQHR